MIVTSMQRKISSRRDIAVLRKKSSPREGEVDVKLRTRLILRLWIVEQEVALSLEVADDTPRVDGKVAVGYLRAASATFTRQLAAGIVTVTLTPPNSAS